MSLNESTYEVVFFTGAAGTPGGQFERREQIVAQSEREAKSVLEAKYGMNTHITSLSKVKNYVKRSDSANLELEENYSSDELESEDDYISDDEKKKIKSEIYSSLFFGLVFVGASYYFNSRIWFIVSLGFLLYIFYTMTNRGSWGFWIVGALGSIGSFILLWLMLA